MAIFHLTVKIGTKEKGHSAGQKCAYITRTENFAKKAPDGQSKFPHPWPPQIPPGSAVKL